MIKRLFNLTLLVSCGLSVAALSARAGVDLNVRNDTYSFFYVNSTSGNVGIGTTTPAAKLQVDGAIYAGTTKPSHSAVSMSSTGHAMFGGNVEIDRILYVDGAIYADGSHLTNLSAGSITASGVVNNVQYKNASGQFAGSNGFVFDGTNVGIGTGNPGVKLHSMSTTEQLRLSYDASNFASFTENASGQLTITSTQVPTVPIFMGLSGGASGGVAIGGTDTRGVLTVQRTDASVYAANTDMGDAGRAFVMQNNSTTDAANQFSNISLQIHSTGSLTGGRVLGDIRLVRQNANQTDSFFMFSAFRQNNTYKDFAKIGYDGSYFVGNIGIGSTTPAAKLQVDGAIYAGTTKPSHSAVSMSSTGHAMFGGNVEIDRILYVDGTIYADGSHLTNITGAISGQVANYVPRATAANVLTQGTIYDNGTNIGIGSSSPQAKLEVDGAVYVNGNVGVGTTIPQAKLEVGTATGIVSGSSPVVAVKNNVVVDGSIYGNEFHLGANAVIQYNPATSSIDFIVN